MSGFKGLGVSQQIVSTPPPQQKDLKYTDSAIDLLLNLYPAQIIDASSGYTIVKDSYINLPTIKTGTYYVELEIAAKTGNIGENSLYLKPKAGSHRVFNLNESEKAVSMGFASIEVYTDFENITYKITDGNLEGYYTGINPNTLIPIISPFGSVEINGVQLKAGIDIEGIDIKVFTVKNNPVSLVNHIVFDLSKKTLIDNITSEIITNNDIVYLTGKDYFVNSAGKKNIIENLFKENVERVYGKTGGITKLQDDLTPILGGDLDAALSNITNIEQLDVNTLQVLTGLMGNLDVAFNNLLNVEQLDVNSINLLTGFMSNLEMQFNNITNVEQLDVNTLNVLTGMMGNLEMSLNKITGLADPFDPQDAATKQYVDDNAGGITKLQDDLTPILGGNLDAEYNSITNIEQLDVNTLRVLTGLMGNLDIAFNNLLNVEQLDVNTINLITGFMSNLEMQFNNITNVEQLDVNTLNVLTGMMGNLEMQLNKITGLADPTADQDAATKIYVDGKSVDFNNVASDIIPDSDNTKNFGSATRRFIQVFTNKLGRDISNYIDLSGTTFSYWATSHNFRAGGNTVFNLYNNRMLMYQNFLPNTTNSKDIGSDLLRFNNVYAKTGNFSDGTTGSFTSQDGKTVTVTNGIITGII